MAIPVAGGEDKGQAYGRAKRGVKSASGPLGISFLF
jgi:hypothetical protein